jgi:hypothetical protein
VTEGTELIVTEKLDRKKKMMANIENFKEMSDYLKVY